MRTYRSGRDGFTMVELVVVIIIIGVLAAVGARKMTQHTEVQRAQETLAEMQEILKAIAGDENLYVDGKRTDFGYVGANSTLPASGTGTIGTALGDAEFNTDAWGDNYIWDKDSLTLTTAGNGETATVALYSRGSLTLDDYENNTINGIVMDADSRIPAQPDCVFVQITYQSGGNATTSPSTSGEFQFTGVPIGNHTIRGTYKTATVPRYVSIVPEVSSYGVELVFTAFF